MFKFSKHNTSSSSSNISQSVIQQQQGGQQSSNSSSQSHSHHHHHQQSTQQHNVQPTAAAAAPNPHHHYHHHHHYYQQQGHGKSDAVLLGNNPLLNFFEVGKYVCSAGPEHVWKVYDGWRKCDGKEVSIFVFEKKMVEKKMKKKEMMADLLRASVKALERYRHPKILQVIYSVEECPETMAFASEPVHGSLSSLISAAHLSSNNTSSSSSAVSTPTNQTVHINGPDSHPVFLDVELKYGILQIIEALQFLHYTGKMLHRNVNTSSILVTKRGTWKLSGLEFMEKANEIDGLESVHIIPWTSKVPKMAQPDLDYLAPEVQITSTCSILSDMFSLGLVITAIFNFGRPLVQSNHSNSQYLKQIEVIESLLADFLPKVPPGLHEALQRLLSKEPRQRPTSQLLALIKYFADPAVHTLQFLDVISMKDPSQKANFYRHQLKDVLPYIPKKLWFQHVWPTLQAEMRSQEVLAAVLQPILLLVQECSCSEVENIILPTFRTVFAAPKSIQATVTLLENLNIVLEKVTEEGFMEKEVIPLLFNAFDSTTVQVQNSALISTALVAHHLDDTFIKKTVLPKTKQIYEKYTGDLKIVLNVLGCLEKILPKLDRSMIIEDVLPILYENAKTQDPDIIVKVVQIYRIMLDDNKKYGLSVNLMATRVLPSLLPQTVNPSLHLEQFTCLLEVMHHMLDHIDRNQRNKLKLDHLTAPQTSSIPNYHHTNDYMSYQRPGLHSKSLHHQRSSDNMSSYSANMFIPNVQIDNLGGSPQGSNSYVSQRKTSSAEDMIRKTSSSDGANFLRVQGQSQFPIRRLSDNTLMAPKIRVAPSSALSSPGDPLPARRHSSIGPERKNSSSSVNLSPPMLARSSIVGGSMPNTTTSSIGNAFLSGSMSSLKSRRPSMLTSSNASVHSTSTLSGANTSGILQQLGTGVVGSKMVRRMSKQFFS